MNKKAILSILLLFSFSFILFYSCNKSTPTTPRTTTTTLPPKKAEVKVELKNRPMTFYHSSYGETWTCDYTVVVSEHNGVGATVTTVKTEVFEGDTKCASLTESGGRLPAYGTLEVWCSITIPDKYKFDKIIITVVGGDDNGHSFSESLPLYFSWDDAGVMISIKTK